MVFKLKCIVFFFFISLRNLIQHGIIFKNKLYSSNYITGNFNKKELLVIFISSNYTVIIAFNYGD